MLIFNLKKEWFEKIKSGEKTHEYRVMSNYWCKRINKEIIAAVKNNELIYCRFLLGYPKNSEKEKILNGYVIRIIQNLHGLYTDLKVNKPVYDIEFKLLECIKNNKEDNK